MQNPNPALNNLPPQVQQILPMLGELDFEQRFSIIDYLYHIEKQSLPKIQKKLAPLDVKLFDKVTMSDDFDDYLGDEFWLGKDA